MTGKISEIDYICGSDGDQEGGIIIILLDKREIMASSIEFNIAKDTFETS